MKKIFTILLFSLIYLFSSGQGGAWTWISGDSANNVTGVFGTQGIPSVSNHPPALYEPAEWKDKQGNFWLYGGVTIGEYSDLWKYNPSTKEWTWVQGNGLTNQPPVYGIKGMANSANTPGKGPFAAASWVDTTGNLWLFGGIYRNDLWQYNISTDNWTWMSGDSVNFAKGVHGIKGVADTSNKPGARTESCSAWTDSLNNLWLFGGAGFDDSATLGILNDLCRYNIASNEWTWTNGSALVNAPADYGVKGVAAMSNDPGARLSYTKWKDIYGNFWIMGGGPGPSYLNDIWKYDVSLQEWIWMDGSTVTGDAGNYNQTCIADTLNMPVSRFEQRSSVTDNCSRFWLFGGGYQTFSSLNDLWVFDPQQLKWKWLSGTNAFNQAGDYGTFGIASPANVPPSRQGAVAWWGNDNQFYMFGGANYSTNYFYADLWVFNPDTNCISVCNTSVNAPPIAGFQSIKTTICANDCINFTDLSTNATSWQWSFAGAIDSTSTAQNPQGICYSTPGIYNVTLIASNSGGSDSLTINNYISVNPDPPTPGITQVNDTLLYCSIDSSYRYYQWFLDSALIPGATDTSIVIHQGGNYNVQVANAAGCKIAVGINIILGLQNYMKENSIAIFPNPVADKLTVYISTSLNGAGLRFTVASVEIYNVLGYVCLQSEISNPIRQLTDEIIIDVSSLPSGIYLLQVVNEKERPGVSVVERRMAKFVKE